jgi:predicted regulator of Ras-like GTPase activity (Roadblock/LC7/MglB family)
MLTTILNELNQSSAAIVASTVLSNDGLTLASVFSDERLPDLDEDILGAMSSALVSLGRKTAEELVGDQLDLVLVEARTGSMLMTHAGSQAILAVVFKAEVNAEAIYGHMRTAARHIEILIASGESMPTRLIG